CADESYRRRNGQPPQCKLKRQYTSMKRCLSAPLVFPCLAALASLDAAQSTESLGDRASRYLSDLIRLDTTNPPGNETRAARYMKQVADREGIPAELLGPDPARLNFIARL